MASEAQPQPLERTLPAPSERPGVLTSAEKRSLHAVPVRTHPPGAHLEPRGLNHAHCPR
jgi:hypothetical protein